MTADDAEAAHPGAHRIAGTVLYRDVEPDYGYRGKFRLNDPGGIETDRPVRRSGKSLGAGELAGAQTIPMDACDDPESVLMQAQQERLRLLGERIDLLAQYGRSTFEYLALAEDYRVLKEWIRQRTDQAAQFPKVVRDD